MELSVLIPTYNRAYLLERTLGSLIQQSLPRAVYEIVIVLDGCTDNTAEMLSRCKFGASVRWISQPHSGRIAARNCALRAAKGRIVLVFDDDLEADSRLLETHLAYHSEFFNSVAFGACPPIRKSKVTGFDLWSIEEFHDSVDCDSKKGSPSCASMDANFSAPRELLLAMGGYDERFSIRELELGLRLMDHGTDFHYLANALAYHLWDKSDASVIKDAEAHGADEVRLCRLRPSYRPFSAFASFENSTSLVRRLRQWLARSGEAGKLALAAASHVKWLGGARRQVRAWKLRQSVAVLRGAIRETGSWSRYKEEFEKRVPVLAYHNVGIRTSNVFPGITVSVADFKAQVRGLLGLGCSTITVEQWLAWRCGTGRLPPRPILITFDDAYEELIHSALPFLIANGCTATVFVPTALVGKTNRWDEAQGYGALQLMNADQIRQWSERGISFGAHARTHRSLLEFSDQELDIELRQTQRELLAITGTRPIGFAYPFGYCDERVRDAVAKQFEASFTIKPGLAALGSDASLLPRIVVDSADRWWGLRIRIFHPWIQQLRDQIAFRSRMSSAVCRIRKVFDEG
jgi:glycosyltransferase involved in cell wall biosynthesis/peptidoglycan/xylan/chitin deacetylase (PgdA/CDA1 family)